MVPVNFSVSSQGNATWVILATTICCMHEEERILPKYIAILTVTSPIVINVPTRGLLAVETKDSFVLWLAKFKYQKNCL